MRVLLFFQENFPIFLSERKLGDYWFSDRIVIEVKHLLRRLNSRYFYIFPEILKEIVAIFTYLHLTKIDVKCQAHTHPVLDPVTRHSRTEPSDVYSSGDWSPASEESCWVEEEITDILTNIPGSRIRTLSLTPRQISKRLRGKRKILGV